MRRKMPGEIDFMKILQAQQAFDEQQQQLEGHAVGLNVMLKQGVIFPEGVEERRNGQVARIGLVIGHIVEIADKENPSQREEGERGERNKRVEAAETPKQAGCRRARHGPCRFGRFSGFRWAPTSHPHRLVHPQCTPRPD